MKSFYMAGVFGLSLMGCGAPSDGGAADPQAIVTITQIMFNGTATPDVTTVRMTREKRQQQLFSASQANSPVVKGVGSINEGLFVAQGACNGPSGGDEFELDDNGASNVVCWGHPQNGGYSTPFKLDGTDGRAQVNTDVTYYGTGGGYWSPQVVNFYNYRGTGTSVTLYNPGLAACTMTINNNGSATWPPAGTG